MKHICLLIGLLVCLSCAASPQANVAGLAGDKKLEDDDIVDSDADEVTFNFAHYEVELDDYGKQRTIKFSLISEFLQNCVVPHAYSCDDNGGIYEHILTEFISDTGIGRDTSRSVVRGAQAIGDKKTSADDEESAETEIIAVTLRQLDIICKQRGNKDGGDPFEITAVSVTDSKAEPPVNGKSVASARLVGSYKKNSKGKIKNISHDDSCFAATSKSAKKVIGYEGGDHGEGKKEDN